MKFNLILLVVVGVIVAGSANHLKTLLPQGPVFNSPTSRYRPVFNSPGSTGAVKTGPFLNGTASTEPAYTCGPNEVYRRCGVGWQCEDYCGRGPNACAYCEDGCYCKKDYIRSGPEFTAGCIPKNQCPAKVPAPVEFFCNVNEVYSECKGCDQYCNRGPVFCTLECSPGCSCRKGYVRSFEGGICIPERDCPVLVPAPVGGFCEVNEVYRECGCCDNFCNREPVFCTEECRKPGCCCKNGYVRSFNGVCIPRNSCPRNQNNGPGPVQSAPPSQCRVNEYYNSCGGCDQICNSEPIACSQGCDRPGCYCQKGYVRSFKGGICIPRNDCPRNQNNGPGPVQRPPPPQCRVNEYYNSCGGCDQICNSEPIACSQGCDRPGCYCQKGYVRSFKGGICIPRNDCPRNQNNGPGPVQSPPGLFCEVNEVYRECGCCDNFCNREPTFCTAECRQPGCCCKNGYVRSFNGGICIPKNSCPRNQNNGTVPVQSGCPRLKCGGINEVYACGSACQTTCVNLGKPCRIVNIKCNDSCYCKEGYARDRYGICINQNEC